MRRIVTGILVVKSRGKKGPYTTRYRFTDTWLNKSGTWQIIGAQDYVIPDKKKLRCEHVSGISSWLRACQRHARAARRHHSAERLWSAPATEPVLSRRRSPDLISGCG